MITDKVKLYNMDCLDGLASIQSSSIDLVVTDPPYEIETKGAGLYKYETSSGMTILKGGNV